MQAINKTKHVQLISALGQLEELLLHAHPGDGCDCSRQASGYCKELETMYAGYEGLLEQLAGQIAAYEALFGNIKVHFLSKKLKALKKEIPAADLKAVPARAMLHHNIRLAYGT